ncbi:Rhizopuspepsin-1 [Neolecta irregularis DAH-3]|uniref:Rhizopuspepsin-1 n=1 Tax=Neolecta irregularis (strain DAH-3) TaxID=1198029 RepID=A0A1U7LRH1_NEOID|nr:Rhizopuspepsin-1 [Neolecta irregularis DAH-3]|eukprot:OLL25244.1 Rhizopuspepsin-1 [Neolecta irregularis DAH-3]
MRFLLIASVLCLSSFSLAEERKGQGFSVSLKRNPSFVKNGRNAYYSSLRKHGKPSRSVSNSPNPDALIEENIESLQATALENDSHSNWHTKNQKAYGSKTSARTFKTIDKDVKMSESDDADVQMNESDDTDDKEDGVVPLVDIERDLEYLGHVEIGTPPQGFLMNFDSGSSDTWVLGPGRGKKNKRHRFIPKKSSTFNATKKKWAVEYGDGSKSSGYVGFDNLVIGNITIGNQAVQIAKSSSGMDDDALDGLVGLGFSGLNSAGEKTPVDNMIEQGLLEKVISYLFIHRLMANISLSGQPN